MPAVSHAQRLAELLIGQPITEWLTGLRWPEGGGRRSYRALARELYEATGGQVDVTDKTIRDWLSDDEPDEKAS